MIEKKEKSDIISEMKNELKVTQGKTDLNKKYFLLNYYLEEPNGNDSKIKQGKWSDRKWLNYKTRRDN